MYPHMKGHTKTTYFILVEGGGLPKVQHSSYKSAKYEAERLCKKTGRPTYILQTLKKYESEITETSYKHKI